MLAAYSTNSRHSLISTGKTAVPSTTAVTQLIATTATAARLTARAISSQTGTTIAHRQQNPEGQRNQQRNKSQVQGIEVVDDRDQNMRSGPALPVTPIRSPAAKPGDGIATRSLISGIPVLGFSDRGICLRHRRIWRCQPSQHLFMRFNYFLERVDSGKKRLEQIEVTLARWTYQCLVVNIAYAVWTAHDLPDHVELEDGAALSALAILYRNTNLMLPFRHFRARQINPVFRQAALYPVKQFDIRRLEVGQLHR